MKFLLVILLYPFAIVYDVATRLRNHLYNTGNKKSVRFDSVIISVGNLTVGGTGKTPHVEYLIRLLKNQFRIATLSRGYGRKTKGFILANDQANANSIGDEPFQFYSKFKKDIRVAVGEERILAIPAILHEAEETQIILLDDAYQHRKVDRDLNILISDYNNPFYEDFVIPSGRLRESRSGAIRANVIIVSKCPQTISAVEREEIRRKISKYANPSAPIFFTTIKYGVPIAFNNEKKLAKGKVLVVSGIARAELFETYVKGNYNFLKHIKFKDHHLYSIKDINLIISEYNDIKEAEKSILITEKDLVKWKDPSIERVIKSYPVFYLPIEVEFIEDKINFDQLILDTIRKRLKEMGK